MAPSNFEDIRPYRDEELAEALQKVVESDYFPAACRFAYPEIDPQELKKQILQIQTISDFQQRYMSHFVYRKIMETAHSLTFSGFDKIAPNTPYLYFANHRDIVLDSAILQILLHHHHLDTSAIAVGSNLMKYPFLDIARINKMFKIERSGKSRELLLNLQHTSDFMRQLLTQQNTSVWIAQRNGRSKDGNDKTDTAVLKMLTMSSKEHFVENLTALNITPIVISYEYESCDFMRTRELYITKRQEYIKGKNEDFESIAKGFKQWKGNIHLTICDSITLEELRFCDSFPERNDKFRQLAQLIDQQIHRNYHLYKTNYIAYDLLHQTTDYQQFYTIEEQQKFLEYAHNGLQNIEGDQHELMKIFLEIYAHPVQNAINAQA